ncbi:uncharacterized protein LOC18030400 [Eutrema salsugineum]|uniref:uncharacterized protein LOC18030400 n=1 Tax=Eutrema salsugineum TaxID=72664 RepID=UPI000CED2B4E|nr:uncharacterized protein LOC18030400 [Eutrema salsugineum]
MVRDTDETFAELPRFLFLLKESNSSTVYNLETEVDRQSRSRFKNLFLAYGSCLRVFGKCRQIIIIDGSSLKCGGREYMFVAAGVDANNDQIPLAFEIVDRESAEKGISIRELWHYVRKSYRIPGLLGYVQQASKAFNSCDFKNAYKGLVRKNPHCAEFLRAIGFERWSMRHSKGDRFDIYTNEVYVLLFVKEEKTIMNLMNHINWYMDITFEERYRKKIEHDGALSPYIEELVKKNLEDVNRFAITEVHGRACVVQSKSSDVYKVSLEKRTCSCVVFQKTMVPCVHSFLASQHFGVSSDVIVSKRFSTGQWLKTYNVPVMPFGNVDEDVLPLSVPLMRLKPLIRRTVVGRPRHYPALDVSIGG